VDGMNLIELILGNSDYKQLINFQEGINNPTCTTFLKDFNGKYLTCNEVMATHFGCAKPSEIIGMNDYEFHPESIAKLARQNDAVVLASKSVKIFNEHFKSLSGSNENMVATSIKMPLKNSKHKIIGIMGLSIINSQTELQEKAKAEYNLNNRQLECLLLLVKGKPIKLIADSLSVAPRTAEHYVEKLKLELNCASKSQLIEKALRIPYIHNQL
jgi:DNA-binding CsgD family transcriptional regulator